MMTPRSGTLKLPAITIWQPWASLILAGVKPYEFRRWEAPRRLVGRRVAIHAGARKVVRAEVQDLLLRLHNDGGHGTGLLPIAVSLLEQALTSPSSLPLGAVLCTAILGTPRAPAQLFRGTVSDSDRIDHQVWAWPLSDIEALPWPEPARGSQGWWYWTQASTP